MNPKPTRAGLVAEKQSSLFGFDLVTELFQRLRCVFDLTKVPHNTAIRISDGNRDRFLVNIKTNVFATIFPVTCLLNCGSEPLGLSEPQS